MLVLHFLSLSQCTCRVKLGGVILQITLFKKQESLFPINAADFGRVSAQTHSLKVTTDHAIPPQFRIMPLYHTVSNESVSIEWALLQKVKSRPLLQLKRKENGKNIDVNVTALYRRLVVMMRARPQKIVYSSALLIFHCKWKSLKKTRPTDRKLCKL